MKYTPSILILLLIIIASCAEESPIPEPSIYLNNNGTIFKDTDVVFEIDAADTTIIEPIITYDYNSKYQWICDGEVISDSLKLWFLPPVKKQAMQYLFVVTTPTGSDTANITVQSMDIIDFDDPKVFNIKSTSTDTLVFSDNNELKRTYKGITFSSQRLSDSTWIGFGVGTGVQKSLNKTTSSSKSARNYPVTYSSYPGKGATNSDYYAVFNQQNDESNQTIQFTSGDHTIKSIDLTNTYYVDYLIKNGFDNIFKKYGDGDSKDWYILTLTGYNSAGTKTGSISVYLADFVNDNITKRYVVEKWATLTLNSDDPTQSLGKVNKLVFSLSSSKVENEVTIMPCYLCIDNIKVID